MKPDSRDLARRALAAVATNRAKTYEITVPHHDRAQVLDGGALSELSNEAREAGLPRESVAVFRGLVLASYLEGDGSITAGTLIDRIENAPDAERRKMANRARELVGLESLDEIEAAAHFEAVQEDLRSVPTRDEQGRAVQECAADGCEAIPTHPSGALRPVVDRKWWAADRGELKIARFSL